MTKAQIESRGARYVEHLDSMLALGQIGEAAYRQAVKYVVEWTARETAKLVPSAEEREYNRDLALRIRDGQVGSGMRYR